MKSRISKVMIFIKNHIFLCVGILVIVGAVVTTGVFFHGGKEIPTITVAPKEFSQEVSVAGKVVAAKEADLSFETSGNIDEVYKDVNDHVNAGELIAAVSNNEIQANLLKAQADLDAEVAKLNEVQTDNGNDTEALNAKRSLVEELSRAYLISDDAIQNKIDQFFKDADKDNPTIQFYFNDYWLKVQIDKDRASIEELLTKWESQKNSITVETLSSNDIETLKSNLRTIQSFVDEVSKAVNAFQIDGTPLTQTQIDKYKTDVLTARTNINDSLSAIITDQEKLRSTEAQVPFQQAKVKSAKAVVASYQAQLEKTLLKAPFTGIIAKQDAKVGQFANSNSPLVTMLSDSSFQIETYVPEININQVQVGNLAKVTLDAFKDTDVFDAKVISIDPGETVRDGVSTYKVVFEFIGNDDRLKTGMTANVDITTEKRDNIMSIPQTAIFKKNGVSFVQVLVGKEVVEKQITTGKVASTGDIEVVSGLNEGEKVVADPKPQN